jgi:hypothetical protein
MRQSPFQRIEAAQGKGGPFHSSRAGIKTEECLL